MNNQTREPSVVTSDMSTYQNMCISVKYIVEIQNIIHQWSSIMYENTQKRNKI